MSPVAPAPPVTILAVTRDPHDLHAERDLVDRARADADAFATLYRQYLPKVHGYALRRTGSVQAAEDITSATFEAALANLHRFRWRPGGFAPWLMRIAANQTIAHHRREGRPSTDRGQRAISTMADDTTPDVADLLPLDDTTHLRAALDSLSDRYQRALTLRYLAGLSHDDAAQAMGMAKPALAVVVSRALKALRRELDRLEG